LYKLRRSILSLMVQIWRLRCLR